MNVATSTNGYTFNLIELSHGGKEVFERLLPQAVLFKIPSNVFPNDSAGVYSTEVFDSYSRWRSDGYLPYPLTATEYVFHESNTDHGGDLHCTCGFKTHNFDYTETAIFWFADEYNLRLVERLEMYDHDLKTHSMVYGIFTMHHDNELYIERKNAKARMDTRTDTYRKVLATEALGCVRRLLYLCDALESVEHTATQRHLTRNEARALGRPRTSWEITIRKRGSHGVPKMREQFAEVVRAAHTVRKHRRQEHLRQYKSGHVAVVSKHDVKAHIRGNGGAVQFKDYLIK